MTSRTQTPAPQPTRARPELLVGTTAIALAVLVVAQNVVVVAGGAPAFGDEIDTVYAFHAQRPGVVALAVGLEAWSLPLLLGFVAGLNGLVRERNRGGAAWSRLTLAAGSTLAAILAMYAVMWIGTALAVEDGGAPGPAFELAWHLHAAAFAFALPALGATFISAALATHASGLTPSWQRALGLVAGGLLIATGVSAFAIADGSALLFVGMPGYAAWPVWLFATGVCFLRATDERS